MSASYSGSLTQLTDMVGRGIEASLKDAIKAKLDAITQPLIDQAAKDLARDIKARVESWQDIRENRVELRVMFNGREL